jgi:hypothetical protein
MEIWNILWTFGIFYLRMYGHLVHFFQFWYHAPRKIWQPRLYTFYLVNTKYLRKIAKSRLDVVLYVLCNGMDDVNNFFIWEKCQEFIYLIDRIPVFAKRQSNFFIHIPKAFQLYLCMHGNFGYQRQA